MFKALLALFLTASLHAQSVTVFLLDDVGRSDLDEVMASGYAPNLVEVAQGGFEFRNAQAMSLCQPTRRSIDFGDFNARWTGRICTSDSASLPLEAVSLPELAGVSSMFFGKWHEGANPTGGPWELSPQAHGWGGWRGGVAGGVGACGGLDYFNWKDVEDGTTQFLFNTFQPATQYQRWQAWWTGRRNPSLAMYATPLAHAPYQRPPNAWLPAGYPGTPTDRAKYKAMIVACDVTIGKMLARMTPSDILIVVGDNGTPGGLIGTARAKGTTFERGINVPLLVYGAGFKGTSDALVHVVDLYATVAEMLGAAADPARDSRSLVPLLLGSKVPVHDYVLCGTLDHDSFHDDVCARSMQFKLRRTQGSEQFYDVLQDPGELVDLIADPVYADVIAAHRAWLDAELASF